MITDDQKFIVATLVLFLGVAISLSLAANSIAEHRLIQSMHFDVPSAPASWHSSKASWYGEEHAGDTMANGGKFDPSRLTCAVNGIAFGTVLRVVHGDKIVMVLVTDRLGYAAIRTGRELDLSKAAFAQLAPLEDGVIVVQWQEVRP